MTDSTWAVQDYRSDTAAGLGVLLSIRSRFANLILSGVKTVELRRRFHPKGGRLALVYSTLPTGAVVGTVRITEVQTLPVEEIWRIHGSNAAVSRAEFLSYYSDKELGCALLLSDPCRYRRPVTLAELRSKHGIDAPQSYLSLRYAHRALVDHERA